MAVMDSKFLELAGDALIEGRGRVVDVIADRASGLLNVVADLLQIAEVPVVLVVESLHETCADGVDGFEDSLGGFGHGDAPFAGCV